MTKCKNCKHKAVYDDEYPCCYCTRSSLVKDRFEVNDDEN